MHWIFFVLDNWTIYSTLCLSDPFETNCTFLFRQSHKFSHFISVGITYKLHHLVPFLLSMCILQSKGSYNSKLYSSKQYLLVKLIGAVFLTSCFALAFQVIPVSLRPSMFCKLNFGIFMGLVVSLHHMSSMAFSSSLDSQVLTDSAFLT